MARTNAFCIFKKRKICQVLFHCTEIKKKKKKAISVLDGKDVLPLGQDDVKIFVMIPVAQNKEQCCKLLCLYHHFCFSFWKNVFRVEINTFCFALKRLKGFFSPRKYFLITALLQESQSLNLERQLLLGL